MPHLHTDGHRPVGLRCRNVVLRAPKATGLPFAERRPLTDLPSGLYVRVRVMPCVLCPGSNAGFVSPDILSSLLFSASFGAGWQARTRSSRTTGASAAFRWKRKKRRFLSGPRCFSRKIHSKGMVAKKGSGIDRSRHR